MSHNSNDFWTEYSNVKEEMQNKITLAFEDSFTSLEIFMEKVKQLQNELCNKDEEIRNMQQTMKQIQQEAEIKQKRIDAFNVLTKNHRHKIKSLEIENKSLINQLQNKNNNNLKRKQRI